MGLSVFNLGNERLIESPVGRCLSGLDTSGTWGVDSVIFCAPLALCPEFLYSTAQLTSLLLSYTYTALNFPSNLPPPQTKESLQPFSRQSKISPSVLFVGRTEFLQEQW